MKRILFILTLLWSVAQAQTVTPSPGPYTTQNAKYVWTWGKYTGGVWVPGKLIVEDSARFYGLTYVPLAPAGDSSLQAANTMWIKQNISPGTPGQPTSAWNTTGNYFGTLPVEPLLGFKDSAALNIITNGVKRLIIPGAGIAKSTDAAHRVLLLDTATHKVYFGDQGTGGGVSLGQLNDSLARYVTNAFQVDDSLLYIVYGGTAHLFATIHSGGGTISLKSPNLYYALPIVGTDSLKDLQQGWGVLFDSSTNSVVRISADSNAIKAIVGTSGTGVTSFSKTDNWGIVSTVTNPNTTPNHAVGVDSSVVASKSYVDTKDALNVTNVFRKTATDSVFQTKGGVDVFAFKDSVGSGGTPAGSDGYVQFKKNGVFAASSDFYWDSTNSRLGIKTTTPQYPLDVNGIARVQALYTTYGVGGGSVNFVTSGTTPTTVDGAVFIGNGTIGSGAKAVSIGQSNTTGSGVGNVAIGYGAGASGSGISIAKGGNPSTVNNGGIAIGCNSANGYQAIGIGSNAQSTSNNTVAIGTSSLASNQHAIALGESAEATALNSIAIGELAKSNYQGSIAIGKKARTTAANQLVIGGYESGGGYQISNIWFGTGIQGDGSSVIDGAPVVINGSGAFGTDKNGGNLKLSAGRGTGAGTPADLIFNTASLGATGTSLQTQVDRWFIKGNSGTFTNTPTPSISAIFQVNSTTQGILQPRMTATQRDAIASPAAGLQLYNSDKNQPNYYDGVTWKAQVGMTFGTAAPSITPVAEGNFFLDTTNKKLYVATGTSSSADWTILN